MAQGYDVACVLRASESTHCTIHVNYCNKHANGANQLLALVRVHHHPDPLQPFAQAFTRQPAAALNLVLLRFHRRCTQPEIALQLLIGHCVRPIDLAQQL
jgi:hypothetical protein